MARAAVKAKQQARAKAQPAKARARGRRRHAGGGNPNQDLFFVKLRRGQRWLYALLALVFAVTFAGVGIGSGGGGLSDLYTGLFGGGGSNPVSKAKAEIEKNPAKGYRDLANAYEANGDNDLAIGALKKYLGIRKNDGNAWSELAGRELAVGNQQATKYASAQQSAQLADPSAPFQPAGTLGTAIGSNSAYQQSSQQASALTSQLYQQATASYALAVTDYQKAARLQPRNPATLEELASAAESAGNAPVALGALKEYEQKFPHAPNLSLVKKQIKALEAGQPTVGSGNG